MLLQLLHQGVLARATNPLLLISGFLAMIVLYHFFGALGFWIAVAGYLGLSILIAYLRREREDRQHIREMLDRGELR
jgi:hypothetical protein